MASSAGNRQEGAGHQGRGGGLGPTSYNNGNNRNPVALYQQMQGKAISMDWTAEEQAILEEGLAEYASLSSIVCYAKIAVRLKNKTVRDVALRCRWMTKRDNSKRRKEDPSAAKKNKDKKEKANDPSPSTSQPAIQPGSRSYGQGMETNNNGQGISAHDTDASVRQLLLQNVRVFEQISANLATQRIQDNIALLCRARDNISKILINLGDIPHVMKPMPPLPVNVNEELFNSILPPATSFAANSTLPHSTPFVANNIHPSSTSFPPNNIHSHSAAFRANSIHPPSNFRMQ